MTTRWQGGGFYRHGDEEQMLADVGRNLSPEAAETIRRNLAIARRPRPLDDRQRSVLREYMAPLLHDLRASDAILPDIREEAHEDRGEDVLCAWIDGPGRTGTGISILLAGELADRLTLLAEQIQEWEFEQLHAAGRPPIWPDCPEHPGRHSLSPLSRSGEAAWVCPAAGTVRMQIGALHEG